MGYVICCCLLLMYICLHYCQIDNYSFNGEKKIIIILYTIGFILSTIIECLNLDALTVIATYFYMVIIMIYAMFGIIHRLNVKIKNESVNYANLNHD